MKYSIQFDPFKPFLINLTFVIEITMLLFILVVYMQMICFCWGVEIKRHGLHKPKYSISVFRLMDKSIQAFSFSGKKMNLPHTPQFSEPLLSNHCCLATGVRHMHYIPWNVALEAPLLQKGIRRVNVKLCYNLFSFILYCWDLHPLLHHYSTTMCVLHIHWHISQGFSVVTTSAALYNGAVVTHHLVFRWSLLAVSVLEVVQAVKEVLWGGGPGQGRQRGGPQERLWGRRPRQRHPEHLRQQDVQSRGKLMINK